jgi:hypothetical protein
MVATTKQFTDLTPRIKQEFTEVKFVSSHEHKWSPDTSTVYYRPLTSADEVWSLLHELSHALLGHTSFVYDVELLGKEVEAWHYAKNQLAPRYDLTITDEAVDAAIETYREWLYKRSTCPNCDQTGQQIKTDTYQCLNCRCLWRVNDARRCGLKRIRSIA